MIAPSTIDELQEHLGKVGASRWHPVTQEDVNRFADATGDDRPVCVARLLIRVRS
jgi:acyl dehydratase